ncbi:MAG TPA: BMP family protein [Thermoanaerobaculia bacterium]|jgi:basic membrane lipoprotein Med (substrate-binding protein (PBP1-ABC) superfamily)
MKRAVLLLLLAATLSCAKREATASKPSKNTDPQPFRVGLLTPGSINDGGWNALAWEGVQRIKTELHAEISHQETKTPAEMNEGFRAFGAKGFDVAFGHGFEYQDPAKQAGSQFPQTIFITTSGNTVAQNVAPMRFQIEEATYLLGVIAARESKAGKAGLVGGINVPSIASSFLAFKAGAQSVNPKFEVREIYTGNFDDLGAAKIAALSLINAGCDFVFHQANEAGRGVFQACSERKVRCFGANADQSALAPDVILASAVVDVAGAYVQMAKIIKEGRFKPQIQHFGMEHGTVGVVWNEKLKSTVSPETVAEVARVTEGIRNGTVKPPAGF